MGMSIQGFILSLSSSSRVGSSPLSLPLLGWIDFNLPQSVDPHAPSYPMHSASQGWRLGHLRQLIAHCYQKLRLGYSSLVVVCQTVILKGMDQEDVIPLSPYRIK